MNKLEKLYPDAKTELNGDSPFELLIATILSAQCTDVRVNIVTEDLFKELKGPADYLEIGLQDLEERIKTCGLYKTKAKNILGTCKTLLEKYGGEVPRTREELMELPGVGRKTANVVMSNAFGIPTIAVDTHVFRVSNRIGLADGKDVDKTEVQLMERIPEDQWSINHLRIILHGRRVCKARNPLCEECTINEECLFYKEAIDAK